MSLLERKTELRPVRYPEFKEAHRKVYFSPWHHEEVDIEPDIVDWSNSLSESEKFLVGNVFKAFTEQEGTVNCYWRKLADYFGQPEIIHMATAFSYQETIHALGYDIYDANLPFNQVVTMSFSEDTVAQKKLADIVEFSNMKDLPTSLAVFSGFVEGVSLYASFGILLFLCRKGYLKAMSQILSWSVRDEHLHSEMGIKLYKKLMQEKDAKINEEAVYEAARLIVSNEIDFIRNAFGNYETIAEMTPDMIISFIHHRANKKLMELGLKPIFPFTKNYKPIADYFYTVVEGKAVNDFFALQRNGDGYSATISQNFTTCNYAI